ncbi:MAG TPA: hypothetical protein VIL71_16385, partial [Spirillospora sp.]
LCGLLTQKQVIDVLRDSRPEAEQDEGECGWLAPKRALVIGDVGRSGGGTPPQSPAEAHTEFVSTKNTTKPGTHYWGWPDIQVRHVKARKSGARAIDGIGDEAFAYTSTGLTEPMEISAVVLRVKSTVLRVEHYYERGKASPEEAHKVARWVARAAR